MEIDIIQAVSQVGFPIVMCIMLMYSTHNQLSAIQLEVKSVKEVVDNMSRIIDILVREHSDKGE